MGEQQRGIAYIIIAMVFFSVMGAVCKYLSENYPVEQIVFFRCLFAFIPLLPLMATQGGWDALKTKKPFSHFWRSLSGLASMFFYFFSLKLLPLADAFSISFCGTLFITILSALILKEKIGLYRWIAVLTGFLGVLFVAQPTLEGVNLGVFLGLCGALCYGFAMIALRGLGATEKALTSAVYFTLYSTILSALPAALSWTAFGFVDLLLFMACGILAGVAQLFLSRAYQLAPASLVSPFNYTSILWGALFGYFFWGTLPTIWVAVGTALIIGSGLFIIYREHQLRLEQKKLDPAG